MKETNVRNFGLVVKVMEALVPLYDRTGRDSVELASNIEMARCEGVGVIDRKMDNVLREASDKVHKEYLSTKEESEADKRVELQAKYYMSVACISMWFASQHAAYGMRRQTLEAAGKAAGWFAAAKEIPVSKETNEALQAAAAAEDAFLKRHSS